MTRFFMTILAVGLTLAVALQATPDTSNGSYTAKLELKVLKNEKSGRVPQLPFSGRFARSGGRFRLEVVNDLTTESQVIILDSTAKKAWMLFPDTLNGISADLGQFDKQGLMSHVQGALSGEFGNVPKNWSKPQKTTEKLNGASVTHLSYTLPQVTGNDGKKKPGGMVHFWHKADATPVQLVVDSAATKLTVNFANVVRGGKVDGGQFVPGKNYKLRALGKGEALPLPGGIPETALDI